jgi:hypothetical protein
MTYMATGNWLCLLAAGVLASASVRGEVTAMDLQVAARALSFMESPLSGRVRVGILYANQSPISWSSRAVTL